MSPADCTSFSGSDTAKHSAGAESLVRLGESDYSDSINRALEEAVVMVVVASRPDQFRSGWVDYEWKSFLNEILSRRKVGQLFTFTNRVSVAEMPYALRSRQRVTYSDFSLPHSFEELYRFIKSAL